MMAKPPAFFYAGAEFDVGTPTGHVGGDGHFAGLAGFGHDLSLALVLLGVQHVVIDAAHLEHARQQFGNLHRSGTDQDRAALVAQFMMSSMTALYFPGRFCTPGPHGLSRIGRLVGITTTSSL
jgi:hypothetical protein